MTSQEFREGTFTREDRIEWNNRRKQFRDKVQEYTSQIKGYAKLTPTQQKAVFALVDDMYKTSLGDEVIINNYEVYQNDTIENVKYKKYYDMRKQGIFLAHESSATLRALEKKGYIKIIEDGGNCIDTVKPLFEIDFTL